MPIYETTKQSAIDLLKGLFNKTYTKIYLSFGSKYNEKRVIYESPSIPDHNTNAPFQMFPAFLRDYPESEQILSICVDNFSNTENRELNRKIIGSVIKDSTDFVFVDCQLKLLDFYTFLALFLKILIENNIKSCQFYCVLYLKFMCPNLIEETFSEKITNVAMNTFKDSFYRNSLFIWFGYHPNLHNFIYPAYYSLAYYAYNLSIIQNQFNYDPIDTYSISDWISNVEPYTQARIIPFLTNCYDITQYSNDGNLWPIYRPL